MSEEKIHHGITKSGQIVHKKTIDHMSTETKYARFNKKVALSLTKYVGTMTCFWIFCLLALCSLPAVLSGFSAFAHVFPIWITKASDIALVAWVAQTFIQLVLLPALMVGQNLQNAASDVRSTKQFEDTEIIVDRLDLETQGGLKDLKDFIDSKFDELTKQKDNND